MNFHWENSIQWQYFFTGFVNSRIVKWSNKESLPWNLSTMNPNLSSINVSYRNLIMPFLINKNSISNKFSFFQQINSIFIFVLDFIRRSFPLEITIFDNNNKLKDNLRRIFLCLLNKWIPCYIKPESLLSTSVLFLGWSHFSKLVLVVSCNLTFFQTFRTWYFLRISTLVECRFYISIQITYDDLNCWWFLLFCRLNQFLNFYKILINLSRLHKRTLTYIW